jgi:gliding motility-associated-like protein
MRNILTVIAFFLCSVGVFAQNASSRPDPMIIENLLQQHVTRADFNARLQAELGQTHAFLFTDARYQVLADKAYGKIRKSLIEKYFRSQLNLLAFPAEVDAQYTALINKVRNMDEQSLGFRASRLQGMIDAHAQDIHHNHDHEAGSNRAPGQPCNNPDFESCNFSNWEMFTGTVTGASQYSFSSPTATTSFTTTTSPTPQTGTGSGNDQHYICNGGTDTYGFPMVYPGGSCSAAIGDFTGYGNMASQIRQTFLVSNGDAILTLHYAVCLEDGGHTLVEQPYFRMRVYDQSGNSITCAEYEATAGDGQAGWQTSGIWQYKPWTTVFIPLAPYIGQNVTVEFTVGDCSQGGHAGYAYVDAECGAMAFDMTASSVCAGQPITINAPSGAASYLWSTGATTQSISTSTPGNYSVTVTPVTGSACAITLDTTVVANPNPTAAFSNNGPVCFGQAITFTDNSNGNGATINQWAWDFGDGQTSTSQNPTHTYAAGGNYNVTLTVTTTTGCTGTVTIAVNQPADLTLAPSSVPETCGACDGTAIVTPAGGTAPYSYNWGGAGGNTPSINGLCTGNYPVTVTDNMGCTETATPSVTSQGGLSITNIASTDEACQGDCQGTITITATGATQFSIDGGTTFQANGNFTGVCFGNYNILVQDASGCSATGTASVSAPNPMTLTVGAGSTICIGQSANLTASVVGGTNPVTLIWDNGLPNGSPQSVTPAATTTYNVYAQDANGCQTALQAITITLNPALSVIASADVNICPGSTANISANASGGNGGPYTYVWDDGAGNILNGQNQIVSPAVTTTFTVTASDNCGTPVATDQVTVTVDPIPVVTFTADNLSGCSPVPVNFTNTTAGGSASCSWDFGDGTTDNNCNPSHVFTAPGCYTITLTVTSPAGCVGTATQANYICVFAYPVADFIFGPQPANILDPEISFTNTSTGATAYEWNFAGLDSSSQVNPTYVFPDDVPNSYLVCLDVVNASGCPDSICKTVVIDDFFTIYVPNAFTPDNDGKNDFFIPILDGIDPTSYQLYIFNRWGDLIFETTDPADFWTGQHRGMDCKEDVYVWKITVKDAVEYRKHTYYGHVSLLR